jgi:hypothetical protein
MRAAFLRAARIGASTGIPGGSGYDVAARVAALKADATDGAFFSYSSNPLAPSGLQLPTAPTITSFASVSTAAALRAAITSGVEITVTADFTETGRTLFDIGAGTTDVRIICTGRTLNITGNYHSFTTNEFSSRIEIVGMTSNGIPQTLGTDIKLKNCSFTGDGNQSNPDANGTGTGVCGVRINWEQCFARGFNGIWFVGPAIGANFVGSVSGTTLTVTSISQGVIHIGAFLYTFGSNPFTRPTYITGFGTGTGGTGTYTVSVSQTRASDSAVTYDNSVNCFAANCSFEAITANLGLTENPSRLNGGVLCGQIDSRIYSSEKYCLRFHPAYTQSFQGRNNFCYNTQLEDEGVQGTSSGGIYPWVTNILLRKINYYAATGASSVYGIGLPRYTSMNVTGCTGNGSVVTITVASDEGTGLTSGDVVAASGFTPSGYNESGKTVTVTGFNTLTYPSTATGTVTGFGILTTAYQAFDVVTMGNVAVYGAPEHGTAGDAMKPNSSPPATWPTCDTDAHALANGNQLYTYVSTPTWAFYTSTPT